MSAGEVEKATGIDRKEIDKAFKELKAEEGPSRGRPPPDLRHQRAGDGGPSGFDGASEEPPQVVVGQHVRVEESDQAFYIPAHDALLGLRHDPSGEEPPVSLAVLRRQSHRMRQPLQRDLRSEAQAQREDQVVELREAHGLTGEEIEVELLSAVAASQGAVAARDDLGSLEHRELPIVVDLRYARDAVEHLWIHIHDGRRDDEGPGAFSGRTGKERRPYGRHRQSVYR